MSLPVVRDLAATQLALAEVLVDILMESVQQHQIFQVQSRDKPSIERVSVTTSTHHTSPLHTSPPHTSPPSTSPLPTSPPPTSPHCTSPLPCTCITARPWSQPVHPYVYALCAACMWLLCLQIIEDYVREEPQLLDTEKVWHDIAK